MDEPLFRLVALALAAIAAVAFGMWRRRTDGHSRAVVDGEIVATGDLDDYALGERFTLLQFSSPTCAPCRVAQRVLAQAADSTDGVTHVELDVTDHLDLASRLHVRRTPTVLLLDNSGQVVSRITGVPTASELDALLASHPHEVNA